MSIYVHSLIGFIHLIQWALLQWRGVTTRKPPNHPRQWTAYLQLGPGHRHVISTKFATEEDAVRAHDRAAIAMYGRERAVLNLPLEAYDVVVRS